MVSRQARPRRIDLLVRAEHIGVRRHPQPHPLVLGVGTAGGGPEKVTLGQDPDHLLLLPIPFGHDDRADAGFPHGTGGDGQRVGGGAGDGGRGHEITDDGFHGPTMTTINVACKY